MIIDHVYKIYISSILDVCHMIKSYTTLYHNYTNTCNIYIFGLWLNILRELIWKWSIHKTSIKAHWSWFILIFVNNLQTIPMEFLSHCLNYVFNLCVRLLNNILNVVIQLIQSAIAFELYRVIQLSYLINWSTFLLQYYVRASILNK